jgi:hypothetical protein
MLRLLRLMTCLICSWSLLLYHTQVYAACDSSDPETASNKLACKESEGKYWDNNTCRCQNSQSAEKLRDVYAECRDEKDEELQRNCMQNLATDASGTEDLGNGVYGNVTGGIAKTITTMNLLIVVISFIGSDVYTGTCISRYMFMVTALGAFGFEVYTYFALENKMKDLRTKYKQEVLCQDADGKSLTGSSGSGSGGAGCMESSRPGPFEAQKKAFQYLEDEQKTIADISQVKWIGYLVIALAYFATFVAAIIEVASAALNPNAASCTVSASTSYNPWLNLDDSQGGSCQLATTQLPKDFEFDPNFEFNRPYTPKNEHLADIKNFLNNHLLASAHAVGPSENKAGRDDFSDLNADKTKHDNKGFKYDKESVVESGVSFYVTLIVGAGVGALAGIIGPVRRFLNTPGGYIALSALGWIGYLLVFPFYLQQHNMAAANAAKVAEVRAMFEAQAGAHCPNGREDLSQPTCYCFLEGGGRNPSREKSETCKALFAKLDSQLDLSGDKDKFGADSDILGCMTSDGKFDRDCRCKLFTDKKTGQSACATAPMANTNVNGIGTGVGINDSLKNLNALTNGSLSRSLGNAINIGRAKRARELGKKLIDKAKKENRIGGNSPSTVAQALAFANKVIPAAHVAAAMANGMGGGSEGGGLTDPGMKSALDQVKEAKKLQMTDGKGKAKEAKKDGPDFNFDLGGAPGADKGDEIGGFMDKKYNYKDNDIVNNEGASIFQVITNRYNQSGYTRLFEEKESAPEQK